MRCLRTATAALVALVATALCAAPVLSQGYPSDGYPPDGYPRVDAPPDGAPSDGYDVGPPDGTADYSEFHQQLQPHGEWIEHPQFGAVWSPYVQEQEADWRPYTRGQWVLTDEYGWYWESEEPWGWATYHYGRWYFDPQDGWVWVPGSVWGPAWVAWRESDDAIGWVPLPPDADWYPDRGIVYRSGYYLDSPRYAALWVFVGASALLAPRVYRHFYPRSRNTFYIGRSRNVTAYRFDNRRIFNRGINPRIVERRIGRPVAVMPVRPVTSAGNSRFTGAQRSFVGIYRPNIVARPAGAPEVRPPFATNRVPTRVAPGVAPRVPERDRGLPRPDGREPWRSPERPPEPRREVAPPRTDDRSRQVGPNNFEPRFARPPAERASRPPEPRRIEEPPRQRSGGDNPGRERPAPSSVPRREPPPEARRSPPPEARRAPPPDASRSAPPQRSSERREGERKDGRRPEGDIRSRGPGN